MMTKMLMVMTLLATVSFAVQGHACDGSKKNDSGKSKPKTERTL